MYCATQFIISVEPNRIQSEIEIYTRIKTNEHTFELQSIWWTTASVMLFKAAHHKQYSNSEIGNSIQFSSFARYNLKKMHCNSLFESNLISSCLFYQQYLKRTLDSQNTHTHICTPKLCIVFFSRHPFIFSRPWRCSRINVEKKKYIAWRLKLHNIYNPQ